jgi:glutathione S-transferase
MIKLYQFPAAWGLPNPSPYCMKLEVYMRLAEIPYEIVTWQDPRKAPKGKLPMIEHDGHRLPDSEFALHFLAERATVDLDGHLSPAERAMGYAVQKMLDEGFYWTGVYSRWVDDRVWPTIKKQFFGHMPPVLRDILPALIRRKVKRDLHAQGIGRHSAKEVYFLADKYLRAVADILGDKPYLLGEKPTSFDATVYAFVANAIVPPFDTELRQSARSHANLVAYCERMKAAAFPE